LIGSEIPGKVVLATEFLHRSNLMPINSLYHTWIQQICGLRPGQRITQVRNMVWLIIGIYQSRSVHLSKVAGKIPGAAKLLSSTRRLSRLLDNPAILVREWYRPIAQQWLKHKLGMRSVQLILDGTKIGSGHQLLMVGLAYRKRPSQLLGWSNTLRA
jgi:hypothetical protein